jgi:hypothetical protein
VEDGEYGLRGEGSAEEAVTFEQEEAALLDVHVSSQLRFIFLEELPRRLSRHSPQ